MRVNNEEDRENGAIALRFLCCLMFKLRRVILRERAPKLVLVYDRRIYVVPAEILHLAPLGSG